MLDDLARQASLPITSAFALIFSWTGLAGISTLGFIFIRSVVLGWRFQAFENRSHVLYVSNQLSSSARRYVRAAAANAGWRVRFSPSGPRRTDVSIAIDTSLQANEIQTGWPLWITLSQL